MAITTDWSKGSMGPGFFIMFPTNIFPFEKADAAGGSGGRRAPHKPLIPPNRRDDGIMEIIAALMAAEVI